MKRSILLAFLATILTLGLAGAQGLVAPVGSVLTSPIQLSEGENGFTAKAGQVTYVEMVQSKLDVTPPEGESAVASDASDRFTIADQNVPQGWGVAIAHAQVTEDADGNAVASNIYAVTVPVGTPAGTYTLEVSVRNLETHTVTTFPLEVTVL